MTECEELTPRGLNLDWQTKESCEVWYTVINIVIDLHQKFMKVSPPKNGNVSYKTNETSLTLVWLVDN